MLKSVLLFHSKCNSITRVIAYSKLCRARYIDSYQYRILDYFENVWHIQKVFQQFEISSQVRENVTEINVAMKKHKSLYENLEQLISLTDLKVNKQLINTIDMQCFLLISSLSHSEILILLNTFLKLTPIGLTMTKFYSKSIIILLDAMENELLNTQQIVHLAFFISLKKENGAQYINYLKPYLKNINELPLIEKCIVAQAFYKSSAKLDISQSQILEEVVEKECNQLIKDPVLLVSLCKVIRISGPSNELKLEYLSKAIVDMKKPFNFTAIAHVLCLYAEALIWNSNAINRFLKDSINFIQQDQTKCNLRLKDFDRFLWSISYLSLKLTLNQKQILKSYFEQRLKEYKTYENLGIFVNGILCLHMLQCWNTTIIKQLLDDSTFEPVFYEKFHWKIKSRLQLLISQITFEMKIAVPHKLKRKKKISYTPSEHINLVAKVFSRLVNKGIIKDVIVECPIDTLQIPGVTLITEKNIYHVDLLDNLTCLKNTYIPHGLMNLKIRMLPLLNYRQILISSNMFNDSTTLTIEIEKEIINKIIDDKTEISFEERSSTL